MIVVSDTTALTYLIQIGRIDLLFSLYGKVIIPEAVRDELLRSHNSLPNGIEVIPVLDRQAVKEILVELDIGEAEAIVLSQQLKADFLLIDEGNGRRMALQFGLDIIGTLGVLLTAKTAGLIPAVKPELEKLAQLDFYFSEELRLRILSLAGEE